jgi:hypothetical protein
MSGRSQDQAQGAKRTVVIKNELGLHARAAT